MSPIRFPSVEGHSGPSGSGQAVRQAPDSRRRLRRAAIMAVPVLVPVSMSAVFAYLGHRSSPRTAYTAGFVVYWGAWCFGFPLWAIGPRRLLHGMVHGRHPQRLEAALLVVPPLGALATELWPKRALVDPPTAAVMVSTGLVNALGEELLWRQAFVAEFPDDVVRGALWPLLGFAMWHLAPQIVLPSSRGRWPFVAAATVVGAASTYSAWRSGSIRNCLGPHAVTDGCGVTAARFRLGHPSDSGRRATEEQSGMRSCGGPP